MDSSSELAGAGAGAGAGTAYWILFLQGLGNLFPWNTLITAAHYFRMRFCGAAYETGFENYFSVVTMLAQVCGLVLSLGYLEKLPLKWCVLLPLALSTAVMALCTGLVVLTGLSQDVLFAVTLLACALFGMNSAVSGGGIFGLSGCLPAEYTAAVMCGQGLGGVVVALTSISSMYFSPAPVQSYCPGLAPAKEEDVDMGVSSESGEEVCEVTVDHSALFFFAACCVVLLLCFVTFFALLVLPFTMYYQERVYLDLMRGMSLEDLHTGLVQHGSEVLLDRILVEQYDQDRQEQQKAEERQQEEHLEVGVRHHLSIAVSEESALLVPLSKEEGRGYGSTEVQGGPDHVGEDVADDWIVGNRGRGVSIGFSEVDETEHYHIYNRGPHAIPTLESGELELQPLPLPPAPPPSLPIAAAAAAAAHHHNTNFINIFYKIYPAATAIFLTLLCTLSLFPSHTVLIESQYRCDPDASRLRNDLFTPFLFLIFYISDFCGRAYAGINNMGITVHTLWKPVWLRFLLLPMMMMCRVEGSYLPLVFESDLWPVLFVMLFAGSNGYVSTLAMMFGPAMVSTRKAPIAGSVMILSLNIGLLVGSVLSFLVLIVSTGNK